MGTAVVRAVPVDTAGGFASSVALFPPSYPQLAQTPGEEAQLPLHGSCYISSEG